MKPKHPNPMLSALALGLALLSAPRSEEALPSSARDEVRVPVQDLDALSDTSAPPLAPPAEMSKPTIPRSLAGPADTVRPVPGLGNPNDTAAQETPPVPRVAASGCGEKGVILASETGKPVAGASVILIGDEGRLSVQSDADGIYALSGVKPARYRLKVGKKGFAVYDQPDLAYACEMPLREVRLERSVMKGQLIEAKGGLAKGSSASMLAARRNASGVMEGVGAEQIGKSTDSDAGAVAKRITGTSLVGGKYIYVRGLGERYTNMTLNGLPVPSPEKDKRVVPQDLFPASALDRFVIYKTFTPELYGDFAGGSVALETKGIPEKRFLKISSGIGGTDFGGDGSFLNFGDRRLSYDGGNTFWGYDDGTRARPDGVPEVIPIREDRDIAKYKAMGLPAPTRQERGQYALAFSNSYALDTAKVHPNQSWSVSYGDVRQTGGNGRAGYLISAGFKNKYNQKDRRLTLLGGVPIRQKVTRYIPVLGRDTTFLVPLVDTIPVVRRRPDGTDTTEDSLSTVTHLGPGITRDVRSGTYEATATGLLNLGWELGSDHNIFWKTLYANIGTDEASRTTSVAVSEALNQDRPVEDRYLLEFNRRSLLTSQLGGGHYVGRGAVDSVSWVAGYSRTRGETPDSRKYLYARENDSASTFENQNNDIWGTRIFEEVGETALAGRLDSRLSIPPEWSVRDTFMTGNRWFSRLRLPEGRIGASANWRSRAFGVSRYSYDKDRIIYTNTPLEDIRKPDFLKAKIEAGVGDFYTSPKEFDEYRAKEANYAAYASTGTGFDLLSVPVDLEGGVRMEGYSLDFIAPYTGDALDDPRLIDSAAKRIGRDEIDWLPSAGLTFQPHRNGKVHLHYARTVTRPEFREIAPYSYTDYLSGRQVTGKADLEKTEVVHYDLRYEWFFPGNQLVSVSLFDKRFANPIEVVADVDKNQTYQNARDAYVRGVEVEGSLDFGHTVQAMGIPSEWIRGLSLYANLALMRSRVGLDENDESKFLTSKSRALVGQSPYLYNIKLTHEREWRRVSVLNALLFNVAGERIREAGVGGAPDIYEQPFPSLDYLGKVGLYKTVEVAWTVKNLMDSGKRLLGYEYNDDKIYYTVDPEVINQSFGGLPSKYDTEVTDEGTSYEVKVTYGF